LDEILDNFLVPFEKFTIDRVKVQPQREYPFPWSTDSFFDAMPETVLEEPIELAPYTLKQESYDLVIIGYQPWFLSPSQPVLALLKDPKFKTVLKNTPVATVIGSRNMWLNAQKSIVREVENAGGEMVANIPFIDKVQNHISALTILHWMLTGKKTRRWGFLPLPGVSEQDIAEAGKFAPPLASAVEKGRYEGVQKDILAQGGINIQPSILLIEARAKKLFILWANLIKRKSTTPEKRAFLVSAFKWYLIIALFVISPPLIFIYTLFTPFLRSKIKRSQQHFLYLGIKNI
jgi:hypothetical protein